MGAGGAIYLIAGQLVIENSTFDSNSAGGGFGAPSWAGGPLGQQGISSPFPVSPKGKPGRVGSPHAGSTLRANKKRLRNLPAALEKGTYTERFTVFDNFGNHAVGREARFEVQ